jgi:hypothetical protein
MVLIENREKLDELLKEFENFKQKSEFINLRKDLQKIVSKKVEEAIKIDIKSNRDDFIEKIKNIRDVISDRKTGIVTIISLQLNFTGDSKEKMDWFLLQKLLKIAYESPDKLYNFISEFIKGNVTGYNSTGFLSTIFYLIHPEKFIEMNNVTHTALNYFKKNKLIKYDNLSSLTRLENYKKNNDQLIELSNILGLKSDLGTLDVFFYWISQNKINNKTNKDIDYWLYAPGEKASKWDEFYNEGIMAIGWDELGDLSKYNSKNDIANEVKNKYGGDSSRTNDAMACFDFVNTIKKGDIIISKKGQREYIGYGIVTSDYIYDDSRKDFKNIRKVDWKSKGSWDADEQIVLKTLTNITKITDYVNKLKKLLNINKEVEIISDKTFNDKLTDYERTKIEKIKKLLDYKKQVILYGPPGTGKTWICDELSKYFDKSEWVVFHPSYSYEEFIEGLKLNKEGKIIIETGIFKQIVNKAKENKEKKFLLIIDEINRGDVSRIFGELIMVLENNKRNQEIKLLYTKENFSIPENLYILGTMNTADRSIVLIDVALRRRFCFYELLPDLINVLANNQIDEDTALSNAQHEDLFALSYFALKTINSNIRKSPNLGKDKQIGHSFIMNKKSDEDFIFNWRYEIMPLIEEYLYGRYDSIKNIIGKNAEKVFDFENKTIKDFNKEDLILFLKSFINE